jgi:NADP-dependent 3-hydroxy acid dehydrogenase YdfG
VTADLLDGTVALVTGASSGIGEATALSLAERGAAVAIGARRVDRLERLADRIRGEGGTALAIELDVTSAEQAQAAVERTVSELGRLDTLVNNAGLMLLGPAVDTPLEDWQRMLDVNVAGVVYCTHAALPHLLRAPESSPRAVADVVNVSSVAGRTVRPGSQVYNLTKHGLGAFSASLRMEVTRHNLRVSLVEPGAVDTELRTHNRPEIQDQMNTRFAEVELLRPEDVAEAILYIVTRPRRIAVNEILVRPTDQAD